MLEMSSYMVFTLKKKHGLMEDQEVNDVTFDNDDHEDICDDGSEVGSSS